MRSQSTIDSRSSAVQQGSASREDTDLGALGRDDVIVANTIPAGYFDSAEPVLVVMGPAGSGKTAVASMIARDRGWDSAEADDFHPQANIDKMAAGIPLNDDDRWGWLDTIATWIRRHVDECRPAVVTCSALKRIYRDRLRMPGVVFVYLDGDYDTVMGLLSHRQGHFMKPEMLASQFAILERPGNDEVHVSLDLGRHPTVEEESRAIVEILHLAPRTA
ncbi:gluconokinase [Bifidobacterium mongoliense]|uniref:gluconokinase n=1 Tax=Bifidobacterium mongoliense TaxID=518643 RepID=UPI0030ED5786